MSEELKLITAVGAPPESFARVSEPRRAPLRVGLVQHRWHPDPAEHRAALAEGVALAAGEGAALVCLQELTLSPYFAITADGPERRGRRSPRRCPTGRPPRSPRELAAATRRARARVALRARRRRRRPGLQHRDRRRARRHARRPHPQAAHPGHRRLLRGQVLPARPARRRRVPGRRAGRRALRLPDVLGPVVPGARARLLARRRRGARLPDRDRLRARPPRLRHPAAVGAA